MGKGTLMERRKREEKKEKKGGSYSFSCLFRIVITE